MAHSGQAVDDHGTADLVKRANTLYWGSDASVNRLAQELDLSKGALYDLIEPFPAGVPCPAGDGEMGYANRTARDRGFVTCSTCGLEEEEGHLLDRLARTGRAPETELPTSAAVSTGGGFPQGPLVGSALIGVAVGFVLASLVRRR